MYGFARRPLWVLSHVLVVVALLVMVRLGFWQMDRWRTEQANSERIEAGVDAPPVPFGELMGELGDPEATAEVPESAEYRRVTVTGTWDTAGEVLVRNRSRGGAPGGWLLTPLVRPDGSAVAVLRGWVPLETANEGPPYPGTEPPEGVTVVTGVVQRTQQAGGLGANDPATGVLESLARVDLGRLAQQTGPDLEPIWVLLQSSQPSQPSGILQPVEVEVPSPSQNFSYMVQWWFFALILGGGYVLILRKVARGSGVSGHRSDVPVDDPPEVVDA